MPMVTMRELLEAGIHFGHQTRRWNPKMARYIFGQRNGIYIIDLQKTLRQIQQAYNLVRDTVTDGGLVLFVGTKKQAQEAVKREAERCGMFYVNSRWLGGTLTNWDTIRRSIRSLHKLEEMDRTGGFDKLPKKEVVHLRKQREKMRKNLDGIKNMGRQPDILFVVDTKKEGIAVKEAGRLGIPCIGVVDTNCDPDQVPIPLPGNDDAIRSVNLFCRVIADAAVEGLSVAEKRKSEADRKSEQARKDRLARERAAAQSAQAAAEQEAETAPAESAPEDANASSAEVHSGAETPESAQ
ncbi:MAG: 30S ribosomal protein S2 [Candidatus Hydrogenedentota bacterium]